MHPVEWEKMGKVKMHHCASRTLCAANPRDTLCALSMLHQTCVGMQLFFSHCMRHVRKNRLERITCVSAFLLDTVQLKE